MSDGGSELKAEYRKMVYDRDYITNNDVFDLLSQVSGIPRGDLQKIILDGKVTPVIVLNPSSSTKYEDFMKWDLLWNKDISLDIGAFCGEGQVDDFGSCWIVGTNCCQYYEDGSGGPYGGTMQFNTSALSYNFCPKYVIFADDIGATWDLVICKDGDYFNNIPVPTKDYYWCMSPSGEYVLIVNANTKNIWLYKGNLNP